MDNILSKNLINLRDAINEIILNSTDKELKSFYNSSIGRMIFDVLEISHSSFNYTATELVDELNLLTAKEFENILDRANEHSYHMKHKIPANVKCRVQIINSNDSRWESISKITLKGGAFVSTIGDYNFVQLSDADFSKNSITEFKLYQAYKKSFDFNISNKLDWSFVRIDESENMCNYINTGLSLDANLIKTNDNETETEYTVIRSVPTESDLLDGNFVMTKVNSDKVLSLQFGNGTFGNRGYGNYTFEYFETKGASANYTSQIGSPVNFQPTGIDIYDLNGNKMSNSDFALDLFEIVTIGEVVDGEDEDTSEDIRYKAMRSNAINSILQNSSDFEFYVNDIYGLDDMQFWGDDVENVVRKMDRKENFNLTFFTSNTTRYDFDLPSNVRYNLLTNKVDISASVQDYNPNSFDIVPDCDRYAHRKLDDCLSFKTLYILGRVKPIAYYYSLLNDENSVLFNIINNIKSKSNDLNFSFIEADTINVNVDVTVTGSSTKTDDEIKTEINDYYTTKNDDKFNIDGSVRNVLAETNYTVKSVAVNPTFSITRFNTDINSIMLENGVGEFDRIVVVKIIDELDIELLRYSKVSSCLQGISNFIDRLSPYIKTSNKEVIKSILIYCINKYNETKSNAINSNELTGLDIPLIQFNLSNINLIKG